MNLKCNYYILIWNYNNSIDLQKFKTTYIDYNQTFIQFAWNWDPTDNPSSFFEIKFV